MMGTWWQKRCAGGARSGSHGRFRGKCGKPFPHNSASQATMARKARLSTKLAHGSNGDRPFRHAQTHGKESEAGGRSKARGWRSVQKQM